MATFNYYKRYQRISEQSCTEMTNNNGDEMTITPCFYRILAKRLQDRRTVKNSSVHVLLSQVVGVSLKRNRIRCSRYHCWDHYFHGNSKLSAGREVAQVCATLRELINAAPFRLLADFQRIDTRIVLINSQRTVRGYLSARQFESPWDKINVRPRIFRRTDIVTS